MLLVGWDAADWKVIRPLIAAGRMPNVQRLIETGTSGNLTTLSPVLSPMLWTSIATGKRPYKHGIYGFIEPNLTKDGVQPITNLSRKTKALWNILSQNSRKSNVIGWWPSHPAEPINGVMVSNQYQRAPKTASTDWPMRSETVHPPELAEDLAELRFHPAELLPEEMLDFVPNAAQIEQQKDHRLDTLARIIADATSIHCAATHLIETTEWDLTAVYFDAIDHFCHAFMRYHPPKLDHVSEQDFEMFQHVVSAGYIYHDMMLGRLLELAGDDTTVMLISDHGFHPGELRPKNMPVEPAGPAVEHRDLGIFVMNGPNVRANHTIGGATLLDITPTILNHFGLAIGDDMDGRVLFDVFETPRTEDSIPSWDDVEGADGRHPPDKAVTAATSKEALKQLADLGYIEQPSDDVDKTVRHAERELNYNLALSYMDGGMHARAAEILTKLYIDYPLEFRFGLRLALCYQAIGQIPQMSRVVEHMSATWKVAAVAARKSIKEFRKTVAERMAGRTSDASDENGSQSDEEFSPRDFVTEGERRVLRHLQAIAKGNPQTIDYLMASIASAQEDYETALSHLENARQSQLKAPGFHLQVGNAYLGLDKPDEAAKCFQRTLEVEPENPLAHLGLARVAIKKGDNADATAHARMSLELNFHNPAAHYFLGKALHGTGEILDAIASLNKAIEQNPNSAEAHKLLTRIYNKDLPDTVRAAQHRTAAQRLDELAKERSQPVAADLPALETLDIEKELPDFPQLEGADLLLPLGADRSDAAPRQDTEAAIVVSGLPRSGTSMAMQMLVAGGVPVLADGERPADENNPLGYHEYAPAKALMTRNDWLGEAEGKAVKVVAPLVPFLPQEQSYKVILMQRPVHEIANSQRTMLDRLGNSGAQLDTDQMCAVLEDQFQFAVEVLEKHEVPHLVLAYKDVISDPASAAATIAGFLSQDLKVEAMAAAVDPSLWRERGK